MLLASLSQPAVKELLFLTLKRQLKNCCHTTQFI